MELDSLSKTMRTFIAVDLEPEIKQSISGLLTEFRNTGARIRWTREDSMHLTLKFLGEISEEKVKEIGSALEILTNKFSAFCLRFKGTGTFPPNSRKPRIFWVGIEESKPLVELHSKLETDMEILGFPRENRKFRPHLTLGRLKKPENLETLLPIYDHYKETEFGEMETKKITFFRSILKSSGAEYHILSEHTLQ